LRPRACLGGMPGIPGLSDCSTQGRRMTSAMDSSRIDHARAPEAGEPISPVAAPGTAGPLSFHAESDSTASQRMNPLNWSVADRALLLICVVTPLTIWYLAVFHYLMANPDAAPFVDRQVLGVTIRLQSGLVAAWLILLCSAVALRKKLPDSQWSTHALSMLFVWTVGYFTFLIGPFSSMFLPGAFLAGTTASLILLNHRIVGPWLIILFLAALLMIGLEQAGVVPYAPLLASAPYENNRLNGSWILTIEAVAFSFLPLIGTFLYVLIRSWRARELELHETKEKLAAVNGVIRRFLPTQVASGIVNEQLHAEFGHERRKITVFFSDVRNFSEIADQLEPEDLSRLLNEYLSEMTHIADRYGATVDQYYGDGILIYFGAPMATTDADHAQRAVKMGLDMLARVRELSDRWLTELLEHPFEIRIGINTGYASVGNYGSTNRMSYMAVGRAVNLAARLQTHCQPGAMLVSHSTWLLVRDAFAFESRGEIEVKGSHLPVRIYEIGLCD
jgi:adenylate cyclase